MKRAVINLTFVFVVILTSLGSAVLAQETAESVREPRIDSALIEKWKSLSPEEKELLRERHKALKNMAPQQRQALKENLDKFKQLPPERQE
ncbi:MAG: DUF3106 domain-containing protein, partial [Candidatus Omnitrophota bacterium]